MEVILLENILNLGNIGDKVTVKNGYGRNYLLKQGKALDLIKENLSYVNKKKDELNKKNTELKNKFKEVAKLILIKKYLPLIEKVKKMVSYMAQLSQRKLLIL